MKKAIIPAHNELKDKIKASINAVCSNYVAVGYYLKQVNDQKLYTEDNYSGIGDYAAAEYGISKDKCSYLIKIADKFCKPDSPELIPEYQDFSISKLREMVYLTEEQLEQVKVDTTVKKIREIQKPKVVEPEEHDIDWFVQYWADDNAKDLKAIMLICWEHTKLTEQAKEVQKLLAPYGYGGSAGSDCSFIFDSFSTGINFKIKNEYKHLSYKDFVNSLLKFYDPNNFKDSEPEVATSQLINSTIALPGCKIDSCFSCPRDCDQRQETRNCRYAPLGNPFSCTTMNVLENIELDGISESCQFFHESGKPWSLCCNLCEDKCGYACQRSMEKSAAPVQEITKEPETVREHCDHEHSGCNRNWCETCGKNEHCCLECEEHCNGFCGWVEFNDWVPPVENEMPEEPEPEEIIEAEYQEIAEPEPEEQEIDPYILAKKTLEKHQKMLNDMLALDETDQAAMPEVIGRQKLEVTAFEKYVFELEELEAKEEPVEQSIEQPELPVMKNNDQRKDFLESYESWPIWIDQKETEERYYRYDLPDGYYIVVKVYFYNCSWKRKEEWGAREIYLLKPDMHFKSGETNTTMVIEHLKAMQKKN